MVAILTILNLVVTSGIFLLLFWVFAWDRITYKLRRWSEGRRKSTLKIIKHDPIEAPSKPMVVRLGGPVGSGTVSYYRPKGDLEAVPFIATHYALASPDDKVMEPDTFVDEMGANIPGRVFRLAFELAEVAQSIGDETARRSRALAAQSQPSRRGPAVKTGRNGNIIVGIPPR